MSLRLTVLALATILVLAAGHSSAQNPTLRTAMHNKLVNTQRLLEAVVTADYAAIGRSVDALSHISETEIASWQVGAQPEVQETGHAVRFIGPGVARSRRDQGPRCSPYGIHGPCVELHSVSRARAPNADRLVRAMTRLPAAHARRGLLGQAVGVVLLSPRRSHEWSWALVVLSVPYVITGDATDRTSACATSTSRLLRRRSGISCERRGWRSSTSLTRDPVCLLVTTRASDAPAIG